MKPRTLVFLPPNEVQQDCPGHVPEGGIAGCKSCTFATLLNIVEFLQNDSFFGLKVAVTVQTSQPTRTIPAVKRRDRITPGCR